MTDMPRYLICYFSPTVPMLDVYTVRSRLLFIGASGRKKAGDSRLALVTQLEAKFDVEAYQSEMINVPRFPIVTHFIYLATTSLSPDISL